MDELVFDPHPGSSDKIVRRFTKTPNDYELLVAGLALKQHVVINIDCNKSVKLPPSFYVAMST